jgi:CHAT domain-containing protein
MSFRLPLFGSEPAVEFPRIPASEREAKTCSREYGSPNTMVLLGPQASRDGLRRALESNPAVLHLATHVFAEDTREEPLILLSSTPPGYPDALTVREVASLRVPGSVVVMSGCASVRGRAMAGAGLLGLSRAWLAAGASGVVASHWPVPDDDNALFGLFYRYLGETATQAPTPAQALRLARADLIRAGGPTASPRYWAAYEYIGRSN